MVLPVFTLSGAGGGGVEGRKGDPRFGGDLFASINYSNASSLNREALLQLVLQISLFTFIAFSCKKNSSVYMPWNNC